MNLAASQMLLEKDGEEMVSPASASLRHMTAADSQKTIMTAARMTSTAMQHYFKSKMEAIIDREQKVPHELLAG
jgi:hypothetical protein